MAPERNSPPRTPWVLSPSDPKAKQRHNQHGADRVCHRPEGCTKYVRTTEFLRTQFLSHDAGTIANMSYIEEIAKIMTIASS